MSGNSEGFIGILCAISLASLATFGITQTVQSQRELERIQIEYRGYRCGTAKSPYCGE
jgi:hypothetical protein